MKDFHHQVSKIQERYLELVARIQFLSLKKMYFNYIDSMSHLWVKLCIQRMGFREMFHKNREKCLKSQPHNVKYVLRAVYVCDTEQRINRDEISVSLYRLSLVPLNLKSISKCSSSFFGGIILFFRNSPDQGFQLNENIVGHNFLSYNLLPQNSSSRKNAEFHSKDGGKP